MRKMEQKIKLYSGNTNQNLLVQSTLKTEMFCYFLHMSLIAREMPTGDRVYLNKFLVLENVPSYRR